MAFTADEKAIIKLCTGFKPDRDKLLISMWQSLPIVDTPEIAKLMNSVVRKVNAMTAANFAKFPVKRIDTASLEDLSHNYKALLTHSADLYIYYCRVEILKKRCTLP